MIDEIESFSRVEGGEGVLDRSFAAVAKDGGADPYRGGQTILYKSVNRLSGHRMPVSQVDKERPSYSMTNPLGDPFKSGGSSIYEKISKDENNRKDENYKKTGQGQSFVSILIQGFIELVEIYKNGKSFIENIPLFVDVVFEMYCTWKVNSQ